MKKDFKTALELFGVIKFIMNKKQKRDTLVLLIVILVGSFFELISVSAILPFIQSIIEPNDIRYKWYGRGLSLILRTDDSKKIVLIIGIVLIFVYLLKNLYLLFSNYLQVKFRFCLMKEMSVRLLTTYVRRPYSFFLNINSAQIMRGINEDVYGVFNIVENAFKFLADLLATVVIGIFILYAAPFLALGVLGLAGICFFIISFVFKNKMRDMGILLRESAELKNKYAYQIVMGIKEIFVMQRRENFIEMYEQAYEKTQDAEIQKNFAVACPDRVIEAVCVGGLLALICIQILLGDNIASFVPQLAAFAVAAFRILPAISRMSGNVNAIIYYRPSAYALYNNICESEMYRNEIAEYIQMYKNNSSQKTNFDKSIELKNIYWSYREGSNILENLNMSIMKGESIALIGNSGAGKTTVADLILGLFKPQFGDIFVDGIDIYTIPFQWSKLIGYVPQSVFLLDDTIANNITFGISTGKNNENKIWNALEQAQLKEYVMSLPDGINTIVGERGVKFSGGQRQRIAIARALFYDPAILVLDEATSALDNETEEAVMESITSLKKHKTLIIIAHRLTTIRNCDKVYEIKDGKAYSIDISFLNL